VTDESLAGIAEVARFGDGPPRLLIEVPHGATEKAHFDAIASRLESPLPPRLEQFFHVNTDFAAPEIAVRVASLLTRSKREARTRGVVVVRALVPRTFVDFNRRIDADAPAGMTPGLPPYISAAADREWLSSLHRRYAAAVSELYDRVCGSGGLALTLHSYAPRSVEIEVDADVVTSLRAAYRPAAYSRWAARPPIDFITRDGKGHDLSPPGLVAALRAAYAEIGLDSGENATYHFHPATAGYAYAARYENRVLCVEYRRDLAGAPWRPFAPGVVGTRKVIRLARPLAAVLARLLETDREADASGSA
jgi:hypothetical protein